MIQIGTEEHHAPQSIKDTRRHMFSPDHPLPRRRVTKSDAGEACTCLILHMKMTLKLKINMLLEYL
jgi:hypothetical protein